MKLPLKTIVDPNFIAACTKLAAQPLAVKDGYALARAIREINAANEDFNAARLAFFQAHGAKSGEGRSETWTLDPARPELAARLEAELGELLSAEIELYLDRKIVLPGDCKLAPLDLLPLLDLVEA
jgi:hypothetical protein